MKSQERKSTKDESSAKPQSSQKTETVDNLQNPRLLLDIQRTSKGDLGDTPKKTKIPLTHGNVQYFQSTIGNQAVSRMLLQREDDAPSTTDESVLKDRADKLHTVVKAAWIDASTYGDKWVLAAEKFGLCYKTAYDQHVAVIKKQKELDKLKQELAFFVLELATTGILGSLTSLAKTTKFFDTKPEWKVEGMADVMKFTGAKGVMAAAKKKAPSPKVPKDPLLFYIGLKKAVFKHKVDSVDYLNGWVQWTKDIKLGKKPLSLVEDLDPLKLDNDLAKWKKGVALFRDPPTIPEKKLIKELEKGMWAKWMPSLRKLGEDFYMTPSGRSIPYKSYTYKEPGKIIAKYVNKLNIPGIKFHTSWWRNNVWTVRKAIAKGENWTPTKTFDLD